VKENEIDYPQRIGGAARSVHAQILKIAIHRSTGSRHIYALLGGVGALRDILASLINCERMAVP